MSKESIQVVWVNYNEGLTYNGKSLYVKSRDGLIVQLTSKMVESELIYDKNLSHDIMSKMRNLGFKMFWIYNKTQLKFEFIKYVSVYDLNPEEIRLMKLHNICNL